MARKHEHPHHEVEIDHYLTRLNPDDEQDRYLMAKIFHQAKEMDITGRTHCGCGKELNALNCFRCVYCGQFLCVKCAEIHFGLTREDYDKTV